jgi:hypothetical protein
MDVVLPLVWRIEGLISLISIHFQFNRIWHMATCNTTHDDAGNDEIPLP